MNRLYQKEESVIRPLTPYAVDKFAAEQYVLIIVIYMMYPVAQFVFNVYGPNQNPNSPYSGVISILVDRYKKQIVGEATFYIIW